MGATTLFIIASIHLSFLCEIPDHYDTYPDGLYLTHDCWNSKPLPIKLFRRKYVCITEKPIVGIVGVASVSDIHHVPDNYSVFRITLTNDAFSTLRETAGHMTNNVFAFVLDNDVIFTFSIDLVKFNTIIEVKGNYRSRDLMLFHEQLSHVVSENASH